MTKPINTTAVGAFVVGAMLILFSIIFYIGGGFLRGDTEEVIMVFEGSVKGLKIGAPLAFKGVQIGEVTSINLVLDTDSVDVITPVVARIGGASIHKTGSRSGENATASLLRKGLRAQLQMQSLLTGLLYIQLDFHPDSPVGPSKYESDLLEIPTIPTDLERLNASLNNIDFAKLLDSIEGIVTGLNTLINNPATQSMPADIKASLGGLQSLSGELETEITGLSPALAELITNTNATFVEVRQELPDLTRTAKVSLLSLDAALPATRQALKNADYVLSDDSALLYDVREAAKEMAAAGRALQSLAETLETQPEALLKGKRPEGAIDESH